MRPVESYVPETEDWLVVEHGDGMAEMPGRDDFLEIRRWERLRPLRVLDGKINGESDRRYSRACNRRRWAQSWEA